MPAWVVFLIGLGAVIALIGLFALLPGEEDSDTLRPKWWWHGGPGDGGL
ncbi:MAG: hypothetical protein AB1416_14135 [Actinomycetota bacterium]